MGANLHAFSKLMCVPFSYAPAAATPNTLPRSGVWMLIGWAPLEGRRPARGHTTRMFSRSAMQSRSRDSIRARPCGTCRDRNSATNCLRQVLLRSLRADVTGDDSCHVVTTCWYSRLRVKSNRLENVSEENTVELGYNVMKGTEYEYFVSL